MLSLVGMGGSGKSALTWFWLHEDLPQEKLHFSGVIWWSFYESEASFESFLAHALLYASGGTIDPIQVPSDHDRMQSLWCILRDSPFLIVFDGVERLLRAYHALDAPYKGDDFSAETGDRHLLCADPRAGQFLQWLASPGVKTRTLVTTRLHPRELQGLAGCRKEELKHLEPDDAVEFMRRQGIKGPRSIIVHACELYDFLPLCLRLLAGVIREDPKRPGNIEVVHAWRPPVTLTEHRHHILQVAYETMAKDRRDLLSRIAAMRGSVNCDVVKVLSSYEDESRLKEALCELVGRGLLFREAGRALYDLHPIIRQYAYDRLGDKAATHRALRDYFDTVPKPKRVRSLSDLMPTIELFHNTVAAGFYDEAFEIFRDQLQASLYYALGAYDVSISLLQLLFRRREDSLPRLSTKSTQALALNSLALAYQATGQNRSALVSLQMHNQLRLETADRLNLAVGLGNIAFLHVLLGELKSAEANLHRCIEIAQEAGDEFHKAFGLLEFGRVLALTGRDKQSEQTLQTALRIFDQQSNEQLLGVAWCYHAIGALLRNDARSAIEHLRRARAFWELHAKHFCPVERDLVRILCLSGSAKRQQGDTVGAEESLEEALSRCRRIRLVEWEADILLEMGKLQWQRAQKNRSDLVAQAGDLVSEALEIAERCEHRLVQADIHNFIAEIALAEGDKATARKHAEIARQRAYCDGAPYSYNSALARAETLLLAQQEHIP